MKLFCRYLREKLTNILLLLSCIAVFAAVGLLYDYSMEAVIYAAALCLYFGAVILFVSFFRFHRRHIELQKLCEHGVTSAEELPEPRGVIETDYLELLSRLTHENSEAELRHTRLRREYEDYYTMWAHQIKTPIAAMRLLLQTGEADSAALNGELFKVEEYVGMALSYARSESMSSDLSPRRQPLDPIIKSCVRKYAPLFISRHISLNYTPANCEVVTDEKWLAFVIEQVLSNALKYTRKGNISIYMDAVAPKTLGMRDTGIGIRAEDVPRVFERGYTGYNGRADLRATGIGLYLCKRIMDKLGHGIDVRSEIGKGTDVRMGLDDGEIVLE